MGRSDLSPYELLAEAELRPTAAGAFEAGLVARYTSPAELPHSWERPTSTDRTPLEVHGVISVAEDQAEVVAGCGLCGDWYRGEPIPTDAGAHEIVGIAHEVASALRDHQAEAHEVLRPTLRVLSPGHLTQLQRDWGREL